VFRIHEWQKGVNCSVLSSRGSILHEIDVCEQDLLSKCVLSLRYCPIRSTLLPFFAHSTAKTPAKPQPNNAIRPISCSQTSISCKNTSFSDNNPPRCPHLSTLTSTNRPPAPNLTQIWRAGRQQKAHSHESGQGALAYRCLSELTCATPVACATGVAQVSELQR